MKSNVISLADKTNSANFDDPNQAIKNAFDMINNGEEMESVMVLFKKKNGRIGWTASGRGGSMGFLGLIEVCKANYLKESYE